MRTMNLDFPDEVFPTLRQTPQEFACELRLAAAAHWYGRGEISQEQAAMIAGLNRVQFLDALARRGIPVFVVDMDDLQEELDRG